MTDSPLTKKCAAVINTPLSWVLLVTAALTGIPSALLLGDTLFKGFYIAFQLTDEPFSTLVAPTVIILILAAINTVVLVAAFFIPNKKIQFATIAFCIVIPIIIEIVDCVIRAAHFFNDLTNLVV